MEKMTRLTIEIPIAFHKKLKAIAALEGKSMKDIILEHLQNLIDTDLIAEGLMERYDETFKKLSKT